MSTDSVQDGDMTELPDSLVELARRYGVATEYQNWTGRYTVVAEATLIAVLDALGVPAATEDERSAALAAHDRNHWERSLPPAIIARSGVASSFWVHVTHGEPVGLWLRLEDGSVRTGLRQLENNRDPFDLGDRLVGEATFELPADLPLGYHHLHLQVGGSDTSTLVIARVACQARAKSRLGPGDSALQRALAKILGHRRFD
jgi:4-alpha-glucanotransferase